MQANIDIKDPELGRSGAAPAPSGGGISVSGEIVSALLSIFGIRTEEEAETKKKKTVTVMGTEDGAKGHAKGGGSKTAVNAVKAAVGKGVNQVKAAAGRKIPPSTSTGTRSSEDSFEDAGGKPAKFVPTLMRAARLAKLYYFGDQKVRARVLLGGMLVMCGCTTGLMVVFSYVQRDMSTALSGKDVAGFYAAIRKYIGVIVVAAPLFAIYHYVQSLVALEWRLWLTRLLVHKYFSNHAYFALKAEGSMDNPDQRICDDVRNFVESCNSVLLAVVQKLLSMAGGGGNGDGDKTSSTIHSSMHAPRLSIVWFLVSLLSRAIYHHLPVQA